VHCIKSPAEPNLHNGAVNTSCTEAVKDNAGKEFELSDGANTGLNPIGGIECPLHRHGEWERGERAAINTDPLAV
jgi:hypothetical protein